MIKTEKSTDPNHKPAFPKGGKPGGRRLFVWKSLPVQLAFLQAGRAFLSGPTHALARREILRGAVLDKSVK